MHDLPKRPTQAPPIVTKDGDNTRATEIKSLQQQIKKLKTNNNWHLSALDLLSDMSAIHGGTSKQADPINIYNQVLVNISQAIQAGSAGLMIADEISGEFELEVCIPGSSYELLINESDELINSGDFAWTLNHHLPQIIQSKTGDDSILLSAFATSSHIYGMLVATLSKQVKFTEALKK